MWFKITQLIKEWFDRMRNIKVPSGMDITLLRPLLILLAITILSYEAIDLFYKIISFPLTKQTAAVKSNIALPVIKDNIQRRSTSGLWNHHRAQSLSFHFESRQ